MPTAADFGRIPSCDVLKQEYNSEFAAQLVTICKDAQPIAALSLLTAVICEWYLDLLSQLLTDGYAHRAVLLYTLVLLVVASTRAMGKQPIWGSTVRDSEKQASFPEPATF